MNSPYTLHLGDCLETLRGMADNSVDACVSDPPYGLSQHSPEKVLECLKAWLAGEVYQPKGKGFMGKSWDAWVPGPEVWREVLRVLKPGGHVLAFAGTRSMDLMSMAIRLAGFELRDSIGYANDGGGAPLLAWTFGSGFPKSHDVSKAIDREAGADREVVLSVKAGRSGSEDETQSGGRNYRHGDDRSITAPATEAASQWQGWGSALKPSFEPIILARKPLVGTLAGNVLEWGTGGLNIMACRVPTSQDGSRSSHADSTCGTSSSREACQTIRTEGKSNHPSLDALRERHSDLPSNDLQREIVHQQSQGFQGDCHTSRHSCGEHVHGAPVRDQESAQQQYGEHELLCLHATGPDNPLSQSTYTTPNQIKHAVQCSINTGRWPANLIHDGSPEVVAWFPVNKAGSAARFFYTAKASRKDRDEGLGEFELKEAGVKNESDRGFFESDPHRKIMRANTHPTVKPTDLMAYLVRLITPPGGIVLDPFMGSGSTGKAAMREGFRFIGCELSPEYLAIAEARIAHELAKIEAARAPAPQFDLFATP